MLNSRSSRPNASFVRANSARTAAGSATSVGTTSARPPRAAPSAAVASSGSARRPASATAYPAFSSASATLFPIPVPAPVTIATFPVPSIPRTSLVSLACPQSYRRRRPLSQHGYNLAGRRKDGTAMPLAAVNGTELYYEVSGQGEPVVLIDRASFVDFVLKELLT